MDPLFSATNVPYDYALDNPIANSDPAGAYVPTPAPGCDMQILLPEGVFEKYPPLLYATVVGIALCTFVTANFLLGLRLVADDGGVVTRGPWSYHEAENVSSGSVIAEIYLTPPPCFGSCPFWHHGEGLVAYRLPNGRLVTVNMEGPVLEGDYGSDV